MANTITIILSAVDKASAVFKKTGDSLQRMAKTAQIAGTAMTAAFTVPLTMMAKSAVNASSAYNEALNKTSLAFGKNSESITKWSENSARAFGMSQRAALQNVSTFGMMFKSMGIAEDQSAEMSKTLTVLAADLASVNDMPIEEAFTKLQAGIAGEAEPLRRLGVDLLETTVQAKAMEMGLAATTKELTQQDKVLARFALVMEQTKPAQGDFANTSKTLANSTKSLTAILEDASRVIGNRLIPTVERVVLGLMDMVDKFIALPAPVQDAIIALGGIVAISGPFLVAAGSVAQLALALKGLVGAQMIAGFVHAVKWVGAFVSLVGQGGLIPAIQVAIPKLYALGAAAWASAGPFAALAGAILLFVKVIHDNWATIQKAVAILAYKATGKMPEWAFKIEDGPRGALDVSSGGLKLENFTKQKTVPGFARGGSFRVPPGYPDDSYLMGVSSGEHVSVNPAGQGSAAPVILNITMPQISGATAQELADQLWPMLRSQLRRGGLAA
jgi:hypothetical protein